MSFYHTPNSSITHYFTSVHFPLPISLVALVPHTPRQTPLWQTPLFVFLFISSIYSYRHHDLQNCYFTCITHVVLIPFNSQFLFKNIISNHYCYNGPFCCNCICPPNIYCVWISFSYYGFCDLYNLKMSAIILCLSLFF